MAKHVSTMIGSGDNGKWFNVEWLLLREYRSCVQISHDVAGIAECGITIVHQIEPLCAACAFERWRSG